MTTVSKKCARAAANDATPIINGPPRSKIKTALCRGLECRDRIPLRLAAQKLRVDLACSYALGSGIFEPARRLPLCKSRGEKCGLDLPAFRGQWRGLL